MSTATAVKIPTAEQEALSPGGACAPGAGLLRAHACLAKRLDAELEHAHGLPMTSYEVLHHLEEAERRAHADVRPGRAGAALAQRPDAAGRPARARGAARALLLRPRRPRLLRVPDGAGRERLEEARGTHLAVVREHFFSRFSEDELTLAGGHVGADRSLQRLLSARRLPRARPPQGGFSCLGSRRLARARQPSAGSSAASGARARRRWRLVRAVARGGAIRSG